jgi:hypothetical protein
MGRSFRSFDPEEDNLLKVARAVQVMDTLDSMDRRDQQTEMQLKGLMLEQERNELVKKQDQDKINNEFRKTQAAGAVADFTSQYDPTDVDHRYKIDWYRNWAVGEGMSAQDINQGFANADNKTMALDNQLAALRAQSGIQDWETIQTPDGRKKIDVASTIAKSNYMKEQLDKEAASWTTSDRQLEQLLIKSNAAGGSRAEIRAMVNENRRALEDYKTVVGNDLWNPPDDFSQKFVQPVNGGQGVVSNDSIGYSPKMYNRDALELDKGYIKARGYAVRMASGEQPVFKRDANGNVEYGNDGVAVVSRWVNTKRESEIAETDKKIAEAQTATREAALDEKYGELGYVAKTAANIQAAISQSPDMATREAGQAQISSLITGNKATSSGGQNTSDDAGAAIKTYKSK